MNTGCLVAGVSVRSGTSAIRRVISCGPWCHREPDRERMWDVWPLKPAATSRSRPKQAKCLTWPIATAKFSIESMVIPINLGSGCFPPHLQPSRKERLFPLLSKWQRFPLADCFMDTVFTRIATSNNAIGAWPLTYDRQQVLTILRQATQQAIQSDQPVLVSFTQPVASCHPLRIFHALSMLEVGERFYWELPVEQRALIGAGAATTIETRGENRFTTSSTVWRHLQQQTIVANTEENLPENLQGPALFGGFAFDPASSHTALWDGFPDGLLIVPYLLFRSQEDSATLTINKLIQKSDDIVLCAEEIFQHIQQLRHAVESTSEAHLLDRKSTRLNSSH